jgi:hypothetical protein
MYLHNPTSQNKEVRTISGLCLLPPNQTCEVKDLIVHLEDGLVILPEIKEKVAKDVNPKGIISSQRDSGAKRR